MNVFHFVSGKPPRRLDSPQPLPGDGFVWIDIARDQARDWPALIEPLLGVEIERNHVSDSLNASHRSFFDGTPSYDMLVFAGLGPCETPLPLEIRNLALFMFDRALLTVRAQDSISVLNLQQRIDSAQIKSPKDPPMLAHLLLTTLIDRFLAVREPLMEHFDTLEEELLAPRHGAANWRRLLDSRRQARKLEALCSDQIEALDAWRRGTRKSFSNPLSVRVRDLTEHAARVMSLASAQERDLESAIQLHFAIAAERTNRIMRVLTVFSAVFLPLTFLVGVYGMNFDYMPELHWRYGYFFALGFMAALSLGLLLLFRRKRYF